MAFVTGLNEKEKVVYYVETREPYDVTSATERLLECECINIQMWAIEPNFENEYFAKYAQNAANIRPL